MFPELKHRLGFLYAERTLETGLRSIRADLSERLGVPVRLLRFFEGRGWGLKYRVLTGDSPRPDYVLKVASRLIERRLRRVQGRDYLPPTQRFRREAGVIASLARAGFGPELLVARESWFVRGYVEGRTFHDLPPESLALCLPTVLEAIDRVCDQGIFHTDTNSKNVIIESGSGRISFIDSEWPVLGELAGLDEAGRRSYCHRRLLFTLGRDYKPPGPAGDLKLRLAGIATGYYNSHGGALGPDEVTRALEGAQFEIRRKQ